MEIVAQDSIWKLKGCVQNYPWGGTEYIPGLICLSNEEQKPFAELWFGQHPSCPSMTSEGTNLAELMAASPERFLTPAERAHWGNGLPFLCKILDVRDMLSIQIHPDLDQAGAGFLKEEELGIDPRAFNRTFRDRNHKPELMYALSEFYLLHDFRTDEEIVGLLKDIPELEQVYDKFRVLGLIDFYPWYMSRSQDQIDDLLGSWVSGFTSQEEDVNREKPEYWVRRAIDRFCQDSYIDRGILSFYLMNIVRLQPGEVIYQGSGIPHAYLSGQNVEIMANSDNVIRGGLTSKYIDYEALGEMVRFDSRSIHLLSGVRKDQALQEFIPPVDDFQLSVIDLPSRQSYEWRATHVSILFSTCNCIKVQTATQSLRVGGGEAVLIRAGEKIIIQSQFSTPVFVVSAQR